MMVCRLVHSDRLSDEEGCLETENRGKSGSQKSVTNSGRSITSQKIWIFLYWIFHRGAAEDSCITKCAGMWLFSNVSYDRISFIFRVKNSNQNGLLGIDDEGAMIIWNVGNYLPRETASHTGRLESQWALLWEPETVACGFSAKLSCVLLATHLAHSCRLLALVLIGSIFIVTWRYLVLF
jgi:hypothetical protein